MVQTNKEWRKIRFNKGLCRYCPEQRRQSFESCLRCSKLKSKEQLKRRSKLRKAKKCIRCHKSSPKGEMCSKCAKKRNANRQRNRAKVRFLVLSHYSGGKPKCYCCNEKMLDFLTIDHIIHGSGNKHRNAIGHQRIFGWLLKNNYPPGYRTACSNCNAGAARHRGVCPHKLKRSNSWRAKS